MLEAQSYPASLGVQAKAIYLDIIAVISNGEIDPQTGESFLYEEIYPQTGNELRCRTLMLW